MLNAFRPSLVMIVLFSILAGLVYPLTITGMAQLVMPQAANGSLIMRNGNWVGSSLIGQNFTAPGYFHSRPSATSAADPNDASKTMDAPYNAANSGGSNYGPTSQKLMDRVKASIGADTAAGFTGPMSGDAVTTSASGLDPDISPQFALAQLAAVAKARQMPQAELLQLVEAHVMNRVWGVFGEPRVNVLQLNLALDQLKQGATESRR
ncbi:MAG: potassium-transporting ATPase subunit KdpC [Hyphomicrobiales bacterium]|nr:potassium-transporting ATPase subunit KdpC [Hyphomicrobiales bacterium]MDE2115980.1 potassium-transporting ATPase subunit KdpC [Hyphomicrobiales bacterium]